VASEKQRESENENERENEKPKESEKAKDCGEWLVAGQATPDALPPTGYL
jgi:hypothetical protein